MKNRLLSITVAGILSIVTSCSKTTSQNKNTEVTNAENKENVVPADRGIQAIRAKNTNVITSADDELKRLADGARAYYAPVDEVAKMPRGKCCKGEECKPGQKTEDSDSWKALDFATTDPHYFAYAFLGDAGVGCDDGSTSADKSTVEH